MFNDDFGRDFDEFEEHEELLRNYKHLKEGNSSSLIEEEDFEIIIDYFIQNNDEAEALEALDIALTFYPYSSSLSLMKAELLFLSKKYGQALSLLNELESLSGKTIETVFMRSDIYLSQQKPEQAIKFLKDSIFYFEGKDKIELMLELSEIYDDNGDFEEVFDTLEAILQLEPHNEDALHRISFWADLTKQQERSIDIHKKLIDQDPFNALVWFNMGAAYQGLKKHEEAINAYDYCLALDDKFEGAYRNIADAYIKLNWIEKAIESLEKNLELGQPEDIIFEALGYCFERKKDYKKARYFYIEALKLNPADDLVIYKIGETYAKEMDWEKAVKSFLSALSLNDQNAACHIALGNCFIHMEKEQMALPYFLKALKLKPNNLKSWTSLLKGLYYIGDYEGMLEQIDAGRNHIGNKADFSYYSVLALFGLGKTKEAMIQLEEAMIHSPRKIKIIIKVAPELLQRKRVIDLITKYKKTKNKLN